MFYEMNRLLSWNIAGIKSAVKKDLGQKLKLLNADVILLQETKTWEKTRPPEEFLHELSEWPHTHFLDCQVKIQIFSS